MELQEKLESALVLYLKEFSTTDIPPVSWPDSINADKQVRIFAGEDNQEKDGQCIICIADDVQQEYPPFTSNYYVPITVWLRTPVRVLSPKEITDRVPEPLAQHAAAAAILDAAINGDGFALAAGINANGTDLTVMGGVLDRRPVRQEVENFWASGWEFKVLAAGKDLTN